MFPRVLIIWRAEILQCTHRACLLTTCHEDPSQTQEKTEVQPNETAPSSYKHHELEKPEAEKLACTHTHLEFTKGIGTTHTDLKICPYFF